MTQKDEHNEPEEEGKLGIISQGFVTICSSRSESYSRVVSYLTLALSKTDSWSILPSDVLAELYRACTALDQGDSICTRPVNLFRSICKSWNKQAGEPSPYIAITYTTVWTFRWFTQTRVPAEHCR